MPQYSLPSQERLKSTKSIARIFSSGKSLHKFPLVLRYHVERNPEHSYKNKEDVHIQVAFTVSKKLFKRAVDRNRIKRLMREVHRHHIQPIRKKAQKKNVLIEMMYIYTGKTIPTLSEVMLAGEHLLFHLEGKLTFD